MSGLIVSGLTVVFASFFEWALHRFVMHRPVGRFDYAFKAHAGVHHQTFKADHTYHLINEKDKWIIPMAWWNGLVLVLITTAIFSPMIWLMDGKWHPITIATTMALYYGTYELIHMYMHLKPTIRKRVFERVPLVGALLGSIFYLLNGHHLLHHRYMHKNFNVVFPLADLICGTLLLKAKVRFKQATGRLVPTVQPWRWRLLARKLLPGTTRRSP